MNHGNTSVEDYESYKHSYALGVVNEFYTNNRMHEWFHERYNPYKYKEIIKLEAERSRLMAEDVFNSIERDNIRNIITSSRLSLDYKATSNVLDEEKSDKNDMNFRHISGHVGRTVSISGIPPEMSKQNLTTAFTNKIQKVFMEDKSVNIDEYQIER